MKAFWLAAIGPALVVLALGPPAAAAEKKSDGPEFSLAGPLTFALQEVPPFGDPAGSYDMAYWIPQGQTVRCGPSPASRVKAYPKLKSKRPMYGSIRFDANPREPASGVEFHFVLDESGEKAAKPGAGGTKTKTTPSKTMKPAREGDESQKTLLGSLAKSVAPKTPSRPPWIGCPYDRLYFDSNGDLDLTNDGAIKLSTEPVLAAMPGGSGGRDGELSVTLDFGPTLGKRPVPIALLISQQRDYVSVVFRTKTNRRGKVALGGEECTAVLSQTTISGRYDRPFTRLTVYSSDPDKPNTLLDSGPLGQPRWIGGRLISIAASPLGDTLTIEPYRGDTGVLEIGAGGRAITEMGFAGFLMSAVGMTPLSQTDTFADLLPRRYTLPVGDYGLPKFVVQYGRLRFAGRLGADAVPATKPPALPVEIRKDKRQVLEFSGKPEVKFTVPTKDKTFSPGDSVVIKAMLTEPWQNMQITGLWDSTKKQKVKYRSGGREIVVRTEFARLVPEITIKDSKGKVRAEGPMPFG
jgi:hypothetical protein